MNGKVAPIMTFREWFDTQQMSARECARLMVISHPTVLDLLARRRFPRKGIRAKVAEITDGQVTDADMIPAGER